MIALLLTTALAAAPSIPPMPKWTPPTVQTRTLASGARLWVIPQKGVPLVHVGVLVNAGSVFDPNDKAGLATLTALAVEEGGSGNRSADEVRAFFDSLGTVLDVGVEPDGAFLTFTVLSPKLEPALGGLVDVIAKPRFDAAALGPLKARQRSEVLTLLDDPGVLGQARLLEAMYGTSPRNHLSSGTVAGIDATSAEDMKQFHAKAWSPANTLFVLVGDVEADAAKTILDKVAPKPWLTSPVAPPLPPPAPVKGAWFAYDKPGAAQTVVVFGRHAVSSKDPARTPLELVATVLGGSFTSRLVQNLREKHGYSYGAGAQLGSGREVKGLFIQTRVKTEVTAPALSELIAELNGAVKLEQADLEKSRALLDSGQLESFASGEGVLNSLLTVAAEELPPAELAAERVRREKATLADLVAAAARFEPSGFTVVLVGDRAKLEKELKAKFPDRAIQWR